MFTIHYTDKFSNCWTLLYLMKTSVFYKYDVDIITINYLKLCFKNIRLFSLMNFSCFDIVPVCLERTDYAFSQLRRCHIQSVWHFTPTAAAGNGSEPFCSKRTRPLPLCWLVRLYYCCLPRNRNNNDVVCFIVNVNFQNK